MKEMEKKEERKINQSVTQIITLLHTTSCFLVTSMGRKKEEKETGREERRKKRKRQGEKREEKEEKERGREKRGERIAKEKSKFIVHPIFFWCQIILLKFSFKSNHFKMMMIATLFIKLCSCVI